MAATGFETAGGILTVIEITVVAFRGCVKLISLISAARHASEDVKRIQLLLEWEQFRLLQWAERVGLAEEHPSPVVINWTIAWSLIDQLVKDLSSAEILQEKYNLIAVRSDNGARNTHPQGDGASQNIEKDPPMFKRLKGHVTKTMDRIRVGAIEKGTVSFQSMTWATMDHHKIRRLIGDINSMNNNLHALLNAAQQDFIVAGMSTLLRDLISRSSSNSELDACNSLLATDTISSSTDFESAIEVKYTRLMAGVDHRNGERFVAQRRNPKLKKIRYENLLNPKSVEQTTWETAIWKDLDRSNVHAQVLLEWRSIPKSAEPKGGTRVMELTLLLSTASSGFNSLKCLGFIKREIPGAMNRYAFVFQLVDLIHSPGAMLSSPMHLRSYMETSRIVSLSYRVHMALTIAQSVLQLHTAGWLHKNISADSIILTSSEGTKSTLPTLFLCGFESARLNAEDTEAVSANPNTELYRHPSYQAGGGDAQHRFRKVYDLYSLGCVLLEIVLWSSLESILFSLGSSSITTSEQGVESLTHNDCKLDTGDKQKSNEKSPQQLAHERRLVVLKGRSRLQEQNGVEEIGERVAHQAGDQMRSAIERCFFPEGKQARTGIPWANGEWSEDEDYLEVSVDAQMEIVDLVQSLKHI